MLGEIGVDGGLQVGDRAEDAAADALSAGASFEDDVNGATVNYNCDWISITTELFEIFDRFR